MSHSPRGGVRFQLPLVAIIAAFAQVNAASTSDPPNPYSAVENWAQLPAGAQWGQVISVVPDAHGNIWVFHRSDPPILEFDASGKVLKSFGTGMFVQAHGLTIDREGNVWVTDAQGKGGKEDFTNRRAKDPRDRGEGGGDLGSPTQVPR